MFYLTDFVTITFKKKYTKEELLQQKRERERRRYERIKSDPEKWEEFRKKQHEIYLRKKEKRSKRERENK